jgi:hypothetical protein
MTTYASLSSLQQEPNTTAKPRQRKPRPKPKRRIRRLCVRPEGLSSGLVRISVGKDEADYLLTELAADFGRGFFVEKVGAGEEDASAYQVNIEGGKGACDCKGHSRHGHCKHGDGLAALIAAGKL